VGKITGIFDLPVPVWLCCNGLVAVYRKPQGLVAVHLLHDRLERVGFSATDFNVDRASDDPQTQHRHPGPGAAGRRRQPDC